MPSGEPTELPKVGEQLPARSFGPFSLEDLAHYAAASGDDNPLHLDLNIARSAGLEAPPVHGMLMMSCFEPAIAIWRPDLAILRLSCKFLRPILAGQSIKIGGRVAQIRNNDPPVAILRLTATGAKNELAIWAEASVLHVSHLHSFSLQASFPGS
jgi:acyl dehydratase